MYPSFYFQPSTNQNCKSEDGSGHIPSSKELVHVLEVDTQLPCQEHPSSSSEDTTTQVKMKATHISMIPTFSMSTLTNSQNPKFQVHHQPQDMLTLQSLQAQKSSSLEEEEQKVKYLEIFMHSIQSP